MKMLTTLVGGMFLALAIAPVTNAEQLSEIIDNVDQSYWRLQCLDEEYIGSLLGVTTACLDHAAATAHDEAGAWADWILRLILGLYCSDTSESLLTQAKDCAAVLGELGATLLELLDALVVLVGDYVAWAGEGVGHAYDYADCKAFGEPGEQCDLSLGSPPGNIIPDR